MTEKVPFILVGIAALAFACGPRPHGESVTEGAAARRVAVNPDAPLTPSLDVNVEDGVRFAFAVTNDGERKVELIFNDGRTHDVVVLDSIGREIWRWSEGRMFTQTVQTKVVRVSDVVRFDNAWRDPEPGTYVAVATLASRNYPVEHRVPFTVR